MLKFWVISSFICLLIGIINAISINHRFIREGYIVNKQIKKSIVERIRDWIYIIVLNSIPAFNIILTAYILFSYEKMYNVAISKLLQNKQIYKPQSNIQ